MGSARELLPIGGTPTMDWMVDVLDTLWHKVEAAEARQRELLDFIATATAGPKRQGPPLDHDALRQHALTCGNCDHGAVHHVVPGGGCTYELDEIGSDDLPRFCQCRHFIEREPEPEPCGHHITKRDDLGERVCLRCKVTLLDEPHEPSTFDAYEPEPLPPHDCSICRRPDCTETHPCE